MTFSNDIKLCSKALTLIALLCASATTLAATSAPSASSQPQPEPRQVLIARTVVEVTQRFHYPAEKLDTGFAHRMLKEYLDTLDPGRFFFTKNEVDRFYAEYTDHLPTDLRHGNLQPAFNIYAHYLDRVHRQLGYAVHLLNKEPDFDGTDNYRFSRLHVPWAANTSALDRLWRERVKNAALVLLLTGKNWKETAETLRKRYERMLHNIEQITSNDVFSTYMNSFTQAQDPHSSYFSPFQSQQFQIEMSLHFEGIGAQLTETNGYATIVRILPGGPAAKNGVLKPGDRITAVGQGKDGKLVDMVGWRLDDIVKKIRGPKGSIVRLKILPAGALPGSDETILTLTRNTVELNAQRAHGHTVFAKNGNVVYKIGIIDVPSFYEDFGPDSDAKNSPNVTSDVRRIIGRMKKEKVSGILLDLRNDGGGSLQQAAALTGLFISKGPVVQILGRRGNTQVLPTPSGEKTVWKGPLAVLVNRFSASATEIFTGALKDYHRALVLGSRTWGKGTVQTLIPLGNYLPGFKAGELKLNMAQFFRVDGASTQLRGIRPDIAFPSPINDKLFGESAYPNALPWKSIPPAHYTPLSDDIDKVLPVVQKYFKNTVQQEPKYQLFEREVGIQEKMNARTQVSLNLKVRQTERDRQRARELAITNAWRKLNAEPPFKTAKAAGNARFSAPDVERSASVELLSEYIAATAHKVPVFSKLVTAIPARELTLCLQASDQKTVRIHCKRGNLLRKASGVFYPPAPASNNGK